MKKVAFAPAQLAACARLRQSVWLLAAVKDGRKSK